jgi:hypothetical protein
MPNPDTCAHCRGALHLASDAISRRVPPPDALRGAMLFGIAVGEAHLDVKDVCDECREQIEHIKKTILGAHAASEPKHVVAAPPPPAPIVTPPNEKAPAQMGPAAAPKTPA